MNEQMHGRKVKRRGRFFVMVFRIAIAFFSFIKKKVTHDIVVIFENGRLFGGLLFLTVGLLSFQSDKYCDGNSSSYYACTRPATYYYYPGWATLLIVFGLFLIVLWFLRNKQS